MLRENHNKKINVCQLHNTVIQIPEKYRIFFNPLNAKLNPICHLLALLGAHHIHHVSRVRVKIMADVISKK